MRHRHDSEEFRSPACVHDALAPRHAGGLTGTRLISSATTVDAEGA